MMMINRRRVCGGKSLPYDAEIEYLESTGTQYIDTGVFPSNNTSVEIEADWLDTNNAELFGVRENGYYFELLSQSGNLWWQYGTATPRSLFKNGKNVYNVVQGVLYINGDAYINGGQQVFTINRALYLLTLNYTHRFANAKVYYCKIENDGNLVRDFIPVRVGNVGYMYDKVSGQLFGNSGTGSFILGPDV